MGDFILDLMHQNLIRLILVTLFIAGMSPRNLHASDHSGELIVKFKNKEINTNSYSQKFQPLNVSHQEVHHFKASSPLAWQDFLNNPDVDYVEWDYFYSLTSLDSRDSNLSGSSFQIEQLSLEEKQRYASLSGFLLDSQKDLTFKNRELASVNSKPILIAVIDTGLDTGHYLFQKTQSVWVNEKEIPGNYIDDDQNGFIDDVHGWNFLKDTNNIKDDQGHGTGVSGVILSLFSNIFGEPSSQVPIEIMTLKVFDAEGKAKSSHIAKSIYYAVDNGARILNLSFGSDSYSHTIHVALAYAYSQGVSIVAAAGNENLNLNEKSFYPASLPIPSLISVASINGATKNFSSFSNYGKNQVHLAAPGESILTAYLGNTLRTSTGTSYATPFIASFVAYMLVNQENLTAYAARQAVEKSMTKAFSLQSLVQTSGFFEKQSFEAFREIASHEFLNQKAPDYTSSSYKPLTQGQLVGGGCGTIAFEQNRIQKQSNTSWKWSYLFFLLILSTPFLMVVTLRRTSSQKRRKFERFTVNWTAQIQTPVLEGIPGSVSSFSLGGVNFKSLSQNLNLKIGTKVSIQIQGKVLDAEIKRNKNSHELGMEFTQNSRKKAYGILKTL